MSKAEARLAAAVAHHAEGRLDEAARLYRWVLARLPGEPDASNNLAAILLDQGTPTEALALLDKVRRRRADHEVNRGNALSALGRSSEAVAAYEAGLAMCGPRAVILPNLAAAFLDMGDAKAAEAVCREAIQLAPGAIDPLINLAGALIALGEFEAAAAAAEAAIGIDDGHPRAWLNLGVARDRLGDFAAAETAYAAALARDPGVAEASFNRALITLRRGDYGAGWAGYEARLALRPTVANPWHGQSLTGRTIRLDHEQGFGDSIQFIRFAPALTARGAKVVARVPNELARLFAGAAGVAEVATFDEAEPTADFACPLPSLPARLGIENHVGSLPYLRADRADIARWRDRLGTDRPVAGLVWAGRPTHQTDRQRSLTLATLSPVLATPGWRFVSLQKGPASAELGTVGGIEDLGARLEDFADTAALMSALDLVISVDTATAHLAGALGVPVAITLPFPADWRWLEVRSDSPWYPSAQLFRQARSGDWAPVIAALAAWLAARVN